MLKRLPCTRVFIFGKNISIFPLISDLAKVLFVATLSLNVSPNSSIAICLAFYAGAEVMALNVIGFELFHFIKTGAYNATQRTIHQHFAIPE